MFKRMLLLIVVVLFTTPTLGKTQHHPTKKVRRVNCNADIQLCEVVLTNGTVKHYKLHELPYRLEWVVPELLYDAINCDRWVCTYHNGRFAGLKLIFNR